MAKIERVSVNTEQGLSLNEEYENFSQNELYLRSTAIKSTDQDVITLDDTGTDKAIQDALTKANYIDGNSITFDQILQLNEKVEEAYFSGTDTKPEDTLKLTMDDNITVELSYDDYSNFVSDFLKNNATETNTKYGQDKFTDEQKQRAKEYMSDEGADNVKAMYMQAAGALKDAGYWDDDVINQRFDDIVNGDRDIGESFGVMIDEMKNNYGLLNDDGSLTDKISIDDWSASAGNVEISDKNEAWKTALESVSNVSAGNSDADKDALISDIYELLYGDGDSSTTSDNAFGTGDKVTVKDTDGNEEEIELSELLSDENLKNLNEKTLQSLKEELEKDDSKDAAGKLEIDNLDQDVLSSVYQYNTVHEKLALIIEEDDYYSDYMDALESGEMTPQEVNAKIPKLKSEMRNLGSDEDQNDSFENYLKQKGIDIDSASLKDLNDALEQYNNLINAKNDFYKLYEIFEGNNTLKDRLEDSYHLTDTDDGEEKGGTTEKSLSYIKDWVDKVGAFRTEGEDGEEGKYDKDFEERVPSAISQMIKIAKDEGIDIPEDILERYPLEE